MASTLLNVMGGYNLLIIKKNIMKSFHCYCLIFLFGFLNAQNNKFIYEYKFIPDSTVRSINRIEFMVLNIGKNNSQFFSLNKYKSDSIQYSDNNKGLMSMPLNIKNVNERIIKFNNSNDLISISYLSSICYQIKEHNDLIWNVLPEYNEILGYKVQKAITKYKGRNWIAWFCSDIPISDGPYKFKGLPGLILKIFDSTNSHLFEIKGIEKNLTDFQYPEFQNYSNKINVDDKQYKKIYKNYTQNPAADLIGKIPDYYDSEGHLIKGQQKVREIEEYRKKEIRENNNMLEL